MSVRVTYFLVDHFLAAHFDLRLTLLSKSMLPPARWSAGADSYRGYGALVLSLSEYRAYVLSCFPLTRVT